MARKYDYSIAYKVDGDHMFRETIITAKSKKMALRKLRKELGKPFIYDGVYKEFD